MRHIGICLPVFVVLGVWHGAASCLGGESDAATARSRADILVADRTPYLGQPAVYWVEQAKSSRPIEPKGRIVDALAKALQSDVPEVRVAAADALGVVGPEAKAAAAELTRLLDDKVAWVNAAAIETLGGMGAAAVPPILEGFEKGSHGFHVRACRVLADIGPEAAAAVPMLERALQKESGPLRDRILQALAAIKAPAAATPGEAAKPRAKALGDLGSAPVAQAGTTDWPQFHGPNRDAICRETGLWWQWPVDGPKLLWKLQGVGRGFSSLAIVDGRLYTMGDRPTEGQQRAQFVLAFDLSTRRELWAAPIGPPHSDGPRCTPTVDGPLVFAVGTDGDLVCLDAADGRVRWRKHFVKDFGGKMMTGWKYSESPLVDGDRLICTPGAKDATLAALDKRTGEVVWKCAVPEIGPRGQDGAAYASMVAAEIEGVRQYVQLIGRGLVGVEAATGRFLWGYNPIANPTAVIPSPIVRGNYVFCSTAYGVGSALLRIARAGDGFRADEVYFLKGNEFQNHHGGMVLVGDCVYGGHGQNQGAPTCVELATGRVCWKAKAPSRGSAAVLYADGHVLFRYDRGLVVAAEADSQEFRVTASFTPVTADGPAWSHPVIHQGKLYLRHNDLLACYDLKGSP